MFSLEKFKPVQHLFIFENFYKKALGILCQYISDKEIKVQFLNNYKDKCVFNKTIFLYKENDDIIGFCMYEIIEDMCFIIFDYVDAKYKGGGRECRKLIIRKMKELAKKINCKIHDTNFLSKNCLKKIKKDLAGEFDIQENFISGFSNYIEFSLEY